MTEQELLEQIADVVQSRDEWGYIVSSSKDLSKDMTAREIRQSYVSEATAILTLIKQAGWKSPDEVAGMVEISKDEAGELLIRLDYFMPLAKNKLEPVLAKLKARLEEVDA